MMEFVKFLTLVDPDITWVRETVDALRETLAGSPALVRSTRPSAAPRRPECTSSAGCASGRATTRVPAKWKFSLACLIGFFALVGNRAPGTFTALEDYRLREKIEELFANQKRRYQCIVNLECSDMRQGF